MSITVSITLIVGLITILLNQDKFSNGSQYYYFAILLFGFLAVLYMVIGAVATLRLLSGKMQVYQMFPADSLLGDADKARMVAIHTEQNANMNVLRSNLFYIAYQSVINSLIILAVLFLIFSINLLGPNKTAEQQLKELKNRVDLLSSHTVTVGELHKKQIESIEKDLSDIKCKIEKVKGIKASGTGK